MLAPPAAWRAEVTVTITQQPPRVPAPPGNTVTVSLTTLSGSRVMCVYRRSDETLTVTEEFPEPSPPGRFVNGMMRLLGFKLRQRPNP